MPQQLSNLVTKLSGLTFGVFLIHLMLIDVLARISPAVSFPRGAAAHCCGVGTVTAGGVGATAVAADPHLDYPRLTAAFLTGVPARPLRDLETTLGLFVRLAAAALGKPGRLLRRLR